MPVVGTFERPELVYRRYVTDTYSDGLSPENTFRKHAGSRSGVPRTPQCEEGGISCRHDRINHPTMPSSRSYMKKIDIEKGSKRADARFRITVEETGPYLVYGQPPLSQQFIMPDAEGESWYFQQGAHFPTDDEPTALCRCGASKNKPYCDGAHVHAAWDPRLTADDAPLLDNVELTEGETLSMTDNPKYCVFARFCDAKGQAWNLVGQPPENDEARELAIREASMCPSGRLMAWDKRDRHSLRIPLRAVAGTHRRRRHRSQQRPVGARRNPRQPRIGRDLRDPQPRRAVPLRRVAQQALLRRHARLDPVQRQARRDSRRRNPPRKSLLIGAEERPTPRPDSPLPEHSGRGDFHSRNHTVPCCRPPLRLCRFTFGGSRRAQLPKLHSVFTSG